MSVSATELGRRLALRRRRGTAPAASSTATAAGVEPATAPLSFAQLGIWLFEEIYKGTAVHNIAFLARIQGEIDADRLRRSVSAVHRRHGALRTVVETGGDAPVQRIEPQLTPPLEVVDLDPSGGEAELGARRLAGEAAARPFDLRHGPLVRVALYRAGSDSFLLICAHHIVADAGSLRVLLEELSAVYSSGGDDRDLPPIEGSYAALAAAERAGERPDSPEDVDYWMECLRDAPVLELPADRRPAQRT